VVPSTNSLAGCRLTSLGHPRTLAIIFLFN